MKLTHCQKSAAWASVLALFAGCSGGGSSSPPAPAPIPAPSTPSITAQPADSTVLTGAQPTFSVTAAGAGDTYQWQRNGTAIAGATASSYQAPAAAWQDDGAKFTVVVANSAGSVTSSAATLHLELSTDQQLSEQLSLAPGGSYEADWELNYTGAQSTPTDYLVYDDSSVALSPLTHGPQNVVQQAPVNLTQSLAIPATTNTRVLKNGVILLVPSYQNSFNDSYVGGEIRVDSLAADNSTVAYSEIRSAYSTTPLIGLLHAAPTELTNPYNSIFANPGVLNTTTSWGSGSAYFKFTRTNLGDRYIVGDCTVNPTTNGTAPAPCNSGTTLAAAMTAGETSVSDATTYHTADGAITTVGGVPIWVATQPRPQSATNAYTVEYRIYFQLNGNIYTGYVVKDGAVVSTSHYRTTPTDSTTAVYLPYVVRLNKAAMLSLASGSLL